MNFLYWSTIFSSYWYILDRKMPPVKNKKSKCNQNNGYYGLQYVVNVIVSVSSKIWGKVCVDLSWAVSRFWIFVVSRYVQSVITLFVSYVNTSNFACWFIRYFSLKVLAIFVEHWSVPKYESHIYFNILPVQANVFLK